MSCEVVQFTYHHALRGSAYLPASPPRSLVVYFHGGGFHSGSYQSEQHDSFFHWLADNGHAVVSGEYRLLMKGVDRENGDPAAVADRMKAANRAAVNDLRRLISFLKDEMENLMSVPLVLAGSSAGAVTALNLTLWPVEACLEDGIQPLIDPPAAVISLAGGVREIESIDTSRLKALLCFHGSADPIVPYYAAPSRWCPEVMHYGGRYLCDLLAEKGRAFECYTALGGVHHWSKRPLTEFRSDILSFLEEVVVEERMRQCHHRFLPS